MTFRAAWNMSQFEVITFDCYGTLIDWKTGIRNAFQEALDKTGSQRKLADDAVKFYAEEEARIESDNSGALYRQILSKTVLAVAQRIGWTLDESDSGFLADDLPSWKPFQDTNPALERLARQHSLGILSNVDNDLLAATLKHLRPQFNFLVTAQNVGSYKPSLGHFKEARKLVGDRSWLHVAASRFHDIDPAVKLGIKAAWINRMNQPVPPGDSSLKFWTFRDLSELADWLHC
ncbi:HAD-IA family hydrolase [Candidatus Bathyarchaeota archaeon]|nr:HAD-IA family hydrolase [Candidatus Bathyarchaeota archaeon]